MTLAILGLGLGGMTTLGLALMTTPSVRCGSTIAFISYKTSPWPVRVIAISWKMEVRMRFYDIAFSTAYNSIINLILLLTLDAEAKSSDFVFHVLSPSLFSDNRAIFHTSFLIENCGGPLSVI